MFIQTRCLYVIGSDRQNSEKIYSSLNNLGLIEKLFESQKNKKEALDFLQLLPDQTVFSKKVTLFEDDATYYYVSLPFFSSHLKMPVKTGEYVWIYPYNSGYEIYESFSINSYWISRVHGLDHSEDVNFTFNDRDLDVKISRKNVALDFEKIKEEKARKKKVLKRYKEHQLDNIIKPEIGFGNSTFELDQKEVDYLKNNLLSYTNNCVPKINNNSEDLLFQGSNNTFIKMSTNDSSDEKYSKNISGLGEINIVSGPGKYCSNRVSLKEGTFIDQSGNLLGDSQYTLLTSSNNLPDVLYHEKEGFKENIKNINLYSTEKIDNNKSNEGAYFSLDDASKIIVSESSNHEFLLNRNFNDNINLSKFSLVKDSFKIKSNIFSSEKNKTYEIFNFSNDLSDTFESNIPCISLISNSINAFSREGSGNICLSKEYYSNEIMKKINAYIRIDRSGDIYIDGNRIFIGSESLEKEKGTFANGKGTIVNIGLGKESQSLVLGEQLKEYMQEMISVNREDMDLTKKLFEEVKNTQSDMDNNTFSELEFALNGTIQSLLGESASIIGAAGSASGAVTQILATINSLVTDLLSAINNANIANTNRLKKLTDEIVLAKLKKDEELSSRMLKISDNIDKILSKISKTS